MTGDGSDGDFNPATWLCASLPTKAFKLISSRDDGDTTELRVLHKESGAVWKFSCSVERRTAK